MAKGILIIVSCADKHQAEKIGETLLKKKLVACVQVTDHADSMFLWPPGTNRIDYAEEALLYIKTLDAKWSSVEKAILRSHSYENPEIIAVPLLHVTKKYLDWMTRELS